MKPWTLEAPELPQNLREDLSLTEAAEAALQNGEDVQAARFTQQTLAAMEGVTLQFTGCQFDKCVFEPSRLKRLDFVDCVFNQCELSNFDVPGYALKRVSFIGCRMTGAGFANGAMRDVTFENGMLDYFAVSESKLERVVFMGCPMRESQWSNVKLSRVRFDHDDLTKTQWSFTPLNGIDVTTCRLEGIRVDLYDLRGLRIAPEQAVSLCGLMGVEIVDGFGG